MNGKRLLTLAALLALFNIQSTAVASTTAFNYTGQLLYTNQPVYGLYDMEFYLYADPTDGTALFWSGPTSVQTDPSGVFTANVDGSGAKQLTTDPSINAMPVWLPDGSGIVYRSTRGGSWGIWTMKADGSGQRKIIDAPTADDWGRDRLDVR